MSTMVSWALLPRVVGTVSTSNSGTCRNQTQSRGVASLQIDAAYIYSSSTSPHGLGHLELL